MHLASPDQSSLTYTRDFQTHTAAYNPRRHPRRVEVHPRPPTTTTTTTDNSDITHMALFAPFHTFDSVLTSPFSQPFHRRRRFCAADPFRLAARMDNPFVQIVRFDPEVSETDEGFLVSALCPGVRDEDLAITA